MMQTRSRFFTTVLMLISMITSCDIVTPQLHAHPITPLQGAEIALAILRLPASRAEPALYKQDTLSAKRKLVAISAVRLAHTIVALINYANIMAGQTFKGDLQNALPVLFNNCLAPVGVLQYCEIPSLISRLKDLAFFKEKPGKENDEPSLDEPSSDEKDTQENSAPSQPTPQELLLEDLLLDDKVDNKEEITEGTNAKPDESKTLTKFRQDVLPIIECIAALTTLYKFSPAFNDAAQNHLSMFLCNQVLAFSRSLEVYIDMKGYSKTRFFLGLLMLGQLTTTADYYDKQMHIKLAALNKPGTHNNQQGDQDSDDDDDADYNWHGTWKPQWHHGHGTSQQNGYQSHGQQSHGYQAGQNNNSHNKNDEAPPPAKPSNTITLNQAYTILGVNHNTPLPEVKKTYRALVFKWHPDKNQDKPDDELEKITEKFKEINTAYEKIREHVKK